jgi:hypothetical protein
VSRRRAFAAAVALLVPAAARAQGTDWLRGYALEVAGATRSSAFGAGGVFDVARLRLEAAPRHGRFSVDLAYEQTLTYAGHPGAGVIALGGGAALGDWLPLDWTGYHGAHTDWHHRFDRLSLGITAGAVAVTVGRQPISWATTLLLTPDDPFAPFSPEDPFREYRIGVDAARVQWYTGAFAELELVIRPAIFGTDTTWSALARGKATVAGWDLSLWGGRLYNRPAVSAGVTRTLGGWGLRGSLAVRRPGGDSSVVRGAVGVDRRVSMAGKDLYVALEYQHDGFGAASRSALPAVALSVPAQRGELQVLGQDVAAVNTTFQWHPLVSLELLLLGDLRDGSAIAAPAVSWAAASNLTLRGGVYLAAGRRARPARSGIGSEFGELPATGYLSASLFF